jgi:hypothetical protein
MNVIYIVSTLWQHYGLIKAFAVWSYVLLHFGQLVEEVNILEYIRIKHPYLGQERYLVVGVKLDCL